MPTGTSGQGITEVAIAGAADVVLTSGVSVTTSPTALPASALTRRRAVGIYNAGSVTVYVGGNDVTTSSGWPVAAGAAVTFDIGRAALYGIVATGTCDVRVMELA